MLYFNEISLLFLSAGAAIIVAVAVWYLSRAAVGQVERLGGYIRFKWTPKQHMEKRPNERK